MPRFTDSWVLNNTMFIYLQGGGACICCAPQPLLFSPEKEPVDGMIRAIDDLNDDEKAHEIAVVKVSPWDEEMRGQVWGDRGLLRWRMRKEMGGYRKMLEGLREGAGGTDDVVIAKLHDFCVNNMATAELYSLFTLSRQDLVDMLKTKYKICSFYTIVFCTVAEQLEHFDMTGIGLDAPECDNSAEVEFERELKFDAKGRGFYFNVVNKSNDDTINEPVLLKFLQRMVTLGGPTLLTCSNVKKNSSSGSKNNNGPSFRSDRRAIRLIIARCWADKLVERYTEFNNNEANKEAS